MSKPPPKSRTPSTQGPPADSIRKASNPSARVPSSKFYDGPTVPASAKQAVDKARQAAGQTAAVARKQGKKAVSTVRRHPWGFASLITTIPFLLAMSLLSTVLCPPPSQTQNFFSKTFTSTLGLHNSPTLHQQLCYPANVYHREVLSPYVYPLIDKAQARAASHPIYVNAVEPLYQRTRRDTLKLWNGPIKPIYTRLDKTTRMFYLKFIQPRIPFLQASVAKATSPLTSRISQTHQTYLAPHISTARKYASQAANGAIRQYQLVANHPLTGHAGRYADKGFKLGRKKSFDAYSWSKPHAIRAGTGAERVIRESVAPRVMQLVNWGTAQADKGAGLVKAQAAKVYYTHLDQHVGPYLAQANSVVSPYAKTFHSKIYKPYIYPAIAMVVPAEVLSPPTPKSFWTLIADILPSAGSHPAEKKASMDNFYEKAKPKANPSFDRKEMDRAREAIRERVDKQGKSSEKKVKEEILHANRNFMETIMPKLEEGGRGEIEREIEYILSGLDKLYSGSTTLTDEQIENAGNMALQRLQKKVVKAKDRGAKQREFLLENIKKSVEASSNEIEAELGKDYEELKENIAGLDGVGPKDQDKFNDIRKRVSFWKHRLLSLQEGGSADKEAKTSNAEVENAVNAYKTYMVDLGEAFRDRVSLLKKVAHDRVEAREAVKQAPPVVASPPPRAASSSSSVSSASASKSAAGGEALAAEAIRLAKEKAEAVAKSASEAVVGEHISSAGYVEAAISVAEDIASSVESVYETASASVHSATRSILSDLGATPSPESPKEHVESIVNAASEVLGNAYEAAEQKVLEASKSIASAVGGEPAPTNIQESVISAARAAGETVASGAHLAASSVSSAASAASIELSSAGGKAAENVESLMAEAMINIHSATRSLMSAAGATPSPEGVQEHLASIGNQAAQGAASVYGVVEENVQSIAGDASSSLHSATRAASKAAGISVTPETPGEYVEDLKDKVSEVAEEAREKVEEVGRKVKEAVVGRDEL